MQKHRWEAAENLPPTIIMYWFPVYSRARISVPDPRRVFSSRVNSDIYAHLLFHYRCHGPTTVTSSLLSTTMARFMAHVRGAVGVITFALLYLFIWALFHYSWVNAVELCDIYSTSGEFSSSACESVNDEEIERMLQGALLESVIMPDLTPDEAIATQTGMAVTTSVIEPEALMTRHLLPCNKVCRKRRRERIRDRLRRWQNKIWSGTKCAARWTWNKLRATGGWAWAGITLTFVSLRHLIENENKAIACTNGIIASIINTAAGYIADNECESKTCEKTLSNTGAAATLAYETCLGVPENVAIVLTCKVGFDVLSVYVQNFIDGETLLPTKYRSR